MFVCVYIYMYIERLREVYIRTNGHVEAAVLELAIFLAQGTSLTAAMNKTIPTWAFRQRVLVPHLGPVAARVHAPKSREVCQHSVERSTCNTSCITIYILLRY